MGLQCVSEDSILLPPTKFDYSTASPTCPFVLNGAPMSNRPTGIPNSGEYRLKSGDYETIALNTDNIIGPESFGNTTLRYEGQTYALKYIAIHKSIWSTGQEVSMVFTTPEFSILHICIPIELTKSEVDTNPFLSHWLYDDSMKPGFTVNELLNFSQTKVSFASLQYCLRYNNKADVTPYTFFMFKTPLKVNESKCEWITFKEASKNPMKTTADEIFNLMMHGHVKYFLREKTDDLLISVESHFSGERTQNQIKPIMYSVKREALFKKKVKVDTTEGFANIPLQNVKCYPINLNSQIDDNGNVIIDQETKKPIDIASINSSAYGTMDPTLAINAQNTSLEANNRIRFWVILGIVLTLAAIILIVLVIYWFRGVSASEPVSANAALTNANRAAANASAAGTGLVGPTTP